MDPQRVPGDADLSADLNAIVTRFREAWQLGVSPDIADYVRDINQPSTAICLLAELAGIDLEFRIKAGEPVRVEAYLERFEELANDEDVAIALIAREHALRSGQEDVSTVEEYSVRFPTYCSKLSQRLSSSSARSRRMRVNCPHCKQPTTVSGDHQKTTCSECGSSFGLEGQGINTAETQLPHLDKFQLQEAVGQGAFGTVYRALDTELERTVAIKIPRAERFVSFDDEDRFAREARSVAQLNHPGIVAVYEVGRSEDFPYLVAEFVQGKTLDEALKHRRFHFRETATILSQLADALQHAHDRGVVHRDLKPANVMLDSSTSEGTPRLMDFGLARRDVGDVTVTLEGQVLGTPAYMSPEQARGDTELVDARSDVYSLGVILHEMLCGELPFRGTLRMLLHQVIHDEPSPPRRFNSYVPIELDTICLKCLEKDPAKRYQSAAEFAAELRRYLNGEPILARPISKLERGWRWCRRNPAVATLTASLIVALLAGIVGVGRQWRRAEAHAKNEATLRVEAQREATTLAEVNRFLNEVLGSANPTELGRDVTVRAAVDEAANKIKDAFQDPIIEAAIRKTLGVTYRSLSDLDRAEFHLRRSVELYEQVRGATAEETLKAKDRLAGVLRSRQQDNDLEEAESIRRYVLSVRRRTLGENHPQTMIALGNLANVLSTAEQHVEAAEIYRKCVASSTKRFGRDSAEARVDRYNLAATLYDLNELEEAESELRQLYQLQRKYPDHPDTLNIGNMLAGVLAANGKQEEGKLLYEEVLVRREEVLGRQHLHTLSTFRRLTRLLVDMREFETALPLIMELLRRHEDEIGFGASLTFGVRRSLARTQAGLQQFDDAEQTLLETYRILRSKRGRRHRYTLEAREDLAEFYESRSRLEKASKIRMDDEVSSITSP